MQSESLKIAGQWKRWFMPLVFCVLLTGVGAAAELDTESGVLRSRVYTFKHISSQQAQEFFSQLHIGKKYNALTPEILIVTSDVGSDLVKATAIADVLDQSPAPKIEILAAAQSLSKPEAFIAGLKSITVGTLTEAPPKGSINPAIIDVLDNQLVAIASEGTINDIKAAFQAWEKEHQPSIPEKAAVTPLTETTVEPNLPPVRPVVIEPAEAPTEPVLLPLIPEPNAPVQPVMEATGSTESLEEVARQLFEASSMAEGIPGVEAAPTELTEPMAELNEPAAAAPAESAEDFLNEGLLEELADAGQQTGIEPAPDETTVAETTKAILPEPTEPPPAAEPNEPPREETSEDESIKMLQALMAQARAEKEQIAAQAAQEQPEETGTIEITEPAGETDPTQSEIEQLRQKLAELEAKSATADTPFPEPAAESKIQAPQTVRTEPQIAPKLAEEELETVMDLPQEVELESLVDLVGKQLGLNYMYDPTILRNQKVQLKVHGGKIKVKDIYSLLESVLKLKGFVMTRENELVTIVKAASADQVYKQVDPVIRTPGEPIEAGNVIVSTLFTLENISTDSAKKMLVSLNLGMTNGFQEIPETGTLLVTDYAYRMGRIEEVLSIIDIPGEKKVYKFRTLKYMTPSEMVPKLQDLAGKLEDVSLQITAPTAPAQQMRTITTRNPQTGRTETKQVPVAAPASAAARAQTSQPNADTVLIDTDDRTNRILMAGKPDQIALVNELIDALDVPQYDLRFVREYLIQNVEAQDVVDVINQLGLASVSVEPTATTSRRTTAMVPVRPGQPTQPQPAAPAAQTAAASGAEQPYISIRAASNSLLVNATAEQHSAIELVIAHVDVVQKDQRTIRQYEIQYVDTQEIMNTLTDLGIIAPQTTGSTTAATSRSTRTTPTRTAQPGQPEIAEAAGLSLPTAEGGSEKDITAQQPQISVLETTNSLLVYATPRQHDAIALVIAHADQELTRTTAPYVVYNLENQNSLELETVLKRLIEETFDEIEKKSTPDSKIQTSGATSSNIPMLQEKRPKVIGDEKSNSIIVYGDKRNQQWISDLIKELDQNRLQVLLDLTLVEVSKVEAFNFDLDVISAYPDLTSLSGALNTNIGTSNVTNILTELETANDRSKFLEGTMRSGQFSGFYGDDEIMGLLTAMQSKNYGRILNRPKLLVNDNEEGTITLEQITYRKITNTIVQGTDNPVTSENVDYKDYAAGITMTIKPHISQEDRLRLEIILNRSDFNDTDTTDENRPPNTVNSDVTTVVTVPNSSTIILGGLERLNQGKGGTKVPILGDIPLIGGLFRSIGTSDDQRKTYIFVKANILRQGEDLSNRDLIEISNKNREQFEKMESEMQEYQDWPGIDSPPMDPVKVLDIYKDDSGIAEGK